jgi:hypothetical protein
MNIQLASAPEVLSDPEAKGLRVTVPLTARPDELLLDAIDASPAVTAYCASVEAEENALALVLKKDAGPDGLGTLMTAVSSLVELTNKDREAAAKSEEERRREELERERAEAEAALQAWWESRS